MNVLIFITFNCNNKCPYCWQRGDEELKKYPMHDGKEWYKALSENFEDDWIDFTGGEPSVVKDFFPMIGLLSKKNMISMTTNLTFDVEKLSHVEKGKLNSLTCSLHPTQKMETLEFFEKVERAKEYANGTAINFVMYPPQMGDMDKYEMMAEKIDVRFHKDPCSGYDYTEEEKEIVFGTVGKDRKPLEKMQVLCTAGSDHCVIYPDGSVRTCLRKSTKLGNIFDVTFKKLDMAMMCGVRHECAGCDRDKVKMYDLEGHELP